MYTYVLTSSIILLSSVDNQTCIQLKKSLPLNNQLKAMLLLGSFISLLFTVYSHMCVKHFRVCECGSPRTTLHFIQWDKGFSVELRI